MKKYSNESIAKKVAEWWTNKIRNLNEKDFVPANCSIQARMDCNFARAMAMEERVSEERLKEFERILYKRIYTELLPNESKGSTGKRRKTIKVKDGKVGCILTDVAKEAGISLKSFPFYAEMVITENEIEVKPTYQATRQYLEI